MAQFYKVQQGDYLAKIADAFGFAQDEVIWNHPRNAQLKQQRRNPNVLFPGDLLYIPDKQVKNEARGTTNRHEFRIHKPSVALQIQIHDMFEKPVTNTECILKYNNAKIPLATNGTGLLKHDISVAAGEAELIIIGDETHWKNERLPIKIGYLDPVTQPSGQTARLNNLGYHAGPVDAPNPRLLMDAVEEFQCDHNLTRDGICGPKTQSMLEKVHGC